MKAKSLLLTVLVTVTGLTFVSLPAGAECWIICPPGSTTTPSSTGNQSATATAGPAASPEELTPAKKPDATANASPTQAPAKPKVAPVPAGATALTPAKKPKATAKVSPPAAPAKPTAAPAPAGTTLEPAA